MERLNAQTSSLSPVPPTTGSRLMLQVPCNCRPVPRMGMCPVPLYGWLHKDRGKGRRLTCPEQGGAAVAPQGGAWGLAATDP